MKRLLPFWCLLFSSVGCADQVPATGPIVDLVRPLPIHPGEEFTVEGRLLGAHGHASIGSRPLSLRRWSPTSLTAVAPHDLPAGQWVLSVVAEGRPAPPFPVEVAGLQRVRRDEDGGVQTPPQPSADAAPPSSPIPDPRLEATFSPDPGGNTQVQIRAQPSAPGELVLEISGPNAWGVAFHLVYDQNLLTLVESRPSGEAEAHGAVINPGRWAYGRLLPPGAPNTSYATLRFVLVGPGEGRLDFPRRHRTLRDARNAPQADAAWTAGSVRVRETP